MFGVMEALVLTRLSGHGQCFVGLSRGEGLRNRCRRWLLLQAGNKLFVLSLQSLDLLLEGQLNWLHHCGILSD